MVLQVEGKQMQYSITPTFYELAAKTKAAEEPVILLASENGRLRELFHKVREGSDVRFVTVKDIAGYDTYRRSAVMLFQAALYQLPPKGSMSAVLHFSVGNGFYLTIKGAERCDAELAAAVEAKMREIVSRGVIFKKRSVPTAEAIALFDERGMEDKAKLFRTRIASRVNVYSLDDYEDYYYGFMAYDASQIRYFQVLHYGDGLILNLPGKADPTHLEEIHVSEKLFAAHLEGSRWADQQGIGSVGDLNEKVITGEMGQTVLTAEALQEGRISHIAHKIAGRKDVKFVMVAGPSSSGKTTFSQRLCTQLRAQGLKPYYIGVDNYFVNREDQKPGPDGRIDFESLAAVDVELFNRDMKALLGGETIRLPSFDFVEGKRIYTGETMKLAEDDLLVIEGIHCLNDALSYSLPAESKFRIYISALTQLSVDEHNRIPSTDGRLIRRIVRDNRTRGYNASRTLAMWNQVRAGEERNIFPFQESADVFFNSALPYEIAALKTYVVPLLFQVEPEDPGFLEARRLLKFLDYFVAIPSEDVPKTSILREFIGGGCFRL